MNRNVTVPLGNWIRDGVLTDKPRLHPGSRIRLRRRRVECRTIRPGVRVYKLRNSRPVNDAEGGTIVEPSSELGAVLGRVFAAINARDADTCLNLHADEPGVLFIGTDPDEWWAGLGSLNVIGPRGPNAASSKRRGVTFGMGEIEAYSEGTVGWVATRPILLVPGWLRTVPLRFTGVLHLDRAACGASCNGTCRRASRTKRRSDSR